LDFHENQHRDVHILVKGIDEFLLIISTLLNWRGTDFVQSIFTSCDCAIENFMKIGAVKGILFLRV
jgi:hypothetical protein